MLQTAQTQTHWKKPAWWAPLTTSYSEKIFAIRSMRSCTLKSWMIHRVTTVQQFPCFSSRRPRSLRKAPLETLAHSLQRWRSKSTKQVRRRRCKEGPRDRMQYTARRACKGRACKCKVIRAIGSTRIRHYDCEAASTVFYYNLANYSNKTYI